MAELRKVMRNTSHNGFPVTRRTAHGEVCRPRDVQRAKLSIQTCPLPCRLADS